MVQNKSDCPQCLGSKKHLKSVGKRRRKMVECNLCDKDGLVESTIAEDFITIKMDVYGSDTN